MTKRFKYLALLMLTASWVAIAGELSFPKETSFSNVRMGQMAHVTIVGRNDSHETIKVDKIKASCGCTTTVLSDKIVPSGGNVNLTVSIETNQKMGLIEKSIRVYYAGNAIPQRLIIRGTVQPPLAFDHAHETGRVSIFSKKCSTCHVVPGNHMLGRELYMTDCAFCHGSNRQGGYAPALTNPMPHWHQVITMGTNLSMPGFLKDYGGSRSKLQIDSIISFLENPETSSSNSKQSLSGRKIYFQNCSMCHGSKQLGGIAPNLIEAKKNYTVDSLAKLLKEGTDHLMMPSFLKEKGGSMTEEQIEKLSEYLINGK